MIHTRDEETIVAQCTPHGSGALAIIRLSGIEALKIATSISTLASGSKLDQVATHTVHFGWVISQDGAKIDQVMFTVMLAPRTFTGQDTVEITCHNNQFIIEDIMAIAIDKGARTAQEGEFSQRAFLNGKIDLIQAEAINELIHAQTQQALKKSLAQLEGTLSRWISDIEQEIMRALAWCDASFEFLDDEQEFGAEIHRHLTALTGRIKNIKKTFDLQQHIRHGVRIALIGSVNAGKSSLFNALLGHNRSIVTSVAGTTRDTVEAGISRKGTYWTLIDTAGIRQTEDIIEQEGVKRSLMEAQKADAILLVFDGSRALSSDEASFYLDFCERYKDKTILVQNKSDLPEDPLYMLNGKSHFPLQARKISGRCPDDMLALEELIDDLVSNLFQDTGLPFLLNARQYKILLSVEQELLKICTLLTGTIHYEIVSFHLRQVLELSTELTGKSISEAALDTVFKEFCVGK